MVVNKNYFSVITYTRGSSWGWYWRWGCRQSGRGTTWLLRHKLHPSFQDICYCQIYILCERCKQKILFNSFTLNESDGECHRQHVFLTSKIKAKINFRDHFRLMRRSLYNWLNSPRSRRMTSKGTCGRTSLTWLANWPTASPPVARSGLVERELGRLLLPTTANLTISKCLTAALGLTRQTFLTLGKYKRNTNVGQDRTGHS